MAQQEIVAFPHRRDKSYLANLHDRLSLDGKNGLIARAIPLEQPREYNGKNYQKRAEISFLGISANNLFDRSRAFIRDGGEIMVDVLEEVFRRHREFEDYGVWLRVRFFFLYPYSTYAISMINAETSTKRCAMYGDSIYPTEQQELQVDEDRFKASSFFKSQKNALTIIQEWIEKYHWDVTHPCNSLAVKFTPISPNLCLLILNDIAYCDSYVFSKEHRYDDRLTFSGPLVKVEQENNPFGFASLQDHFRYLWQMNIALDCFDATEYEPGIEDSLGKIKAPKEITFEHKATRLVEKRRIAVEKQRSWVMKVRRQFFRYVTVPEESIKFERIFISCSWEDNEYGEPRPNALASRIKDWIQNDISRYEPNLQPIIVQGDPGERLSDTLFHLLDTSMLGISLLTDDIQLKDDHGHVVERLSRHNVYHELGYLMRSLESERKIFIGLEQGVKLASNVTNRIYRPIKSTAKIKEARKGENIEIALIQACYLYIEILSWLHKESSLLRHETFCHAVALHETRIKEHFGTLTANDQAEMLNKLKSLRDEYCADKS